jgi:recombination protein RecA
VKVVKNKVAPPFKRAEFDIMFGEGISKSGEIIDLGVEYNIIQKSGSWFSYDGSKLAQGRDAAKRVISDNPELAEELEEKIMQALMGDAHAGASKGAEKDEVEEPDFDTTLPDDFSIEED